MNNEELPDYKQTFLKEMEELRQQQLREQFPEENNILAQQRAKQYAIHDIELLRFKTTSSTLLSIPPRIGSNTSRNLHTTDTMIVLTTS